MLKPTETAFRAMMAVDATITKERADAVFRSPAQCMRQAGAVRGADGKRAPGIEQALLRCVPLSPAWAVPCPPLSDINRHLFDIFSCTETGGGRGNQAGRDLNAKPRKTWAFRVFSGVVKWSQQWESDPRPAHYE